MNGKTRDMRVEFEGAMEDGRRRKRKKRDRRRKKEKVGIPVI